MTYLLDAIYFVVDMHVGCNVTSAYILFDVSVNHSIDSV